MNNESEKELNVAASTGVEEESTIIDEEDNLEFSENDIDNSQDPQKNDEVGSDSLSDTNEIVNQEELPKTSQSKEDNSKYASARRKAEEESKVKIDEAYKKGMLDAYKGKINPYTNTEIKDLTDIEVYEDMYKLAEAGKDPLKDYASYTADKRREEIRLQKEEQEKIQKAQAEIDEFISKYPDVDISSLLRDDMFIDYAEGKTKTLVQTYESFTKFYNSFRNKGVETAKKTIANNMSSPGSLGSSSNGGIVDYENMSREEFLKEVERVKER